MSRLNKFKAEMTKAGFDAAVISSHVNVRYLTDFDYHDGYVLVTKNKSYVLADFRYIEVARATVNPADFEVIMPEGSMLVTIASLLDENEAKRVAFEDYTLACADLERMKKVFVGKDLGDIVQRFEGNEAFGRDLGIVEAVDKVVDVGAGEVDLADAAALQAVEIDIPEP